MRAFRAAPTAIVGVGGGWGVGGHPCILTNDIWSRLVRRLPYIARRLTLGRYQARLKPRYGS